MGSINASLLGTLMIGLMIIMAATGYYLGKRKTETPLLTTILAVVSALIPPLALIFLMILVLKKDVRPAAPIR